MNWNLADETKALLQTYSKIYGIHKHLIFENSAQQNH